MASLMLARKAENASTLEKLIATVTGFTCTFAASVNCAVIQSDVDTKITVKWSASAPTAEGTNAAPVAGWSYYVGPSYGPVFVMTEDFATSLGIYNAGGVTAVLKVNAWLAPLN